MLLTDSGGQRDGGGSAYEGVAPFESEGAGRSFQQGEFHCIS